MLLPFLGHIGATLYFQLKGVEGKGIVNLLNQ